MIRINENEIEFRDGMTVKDAMNEVKYTFPMVIVSVNGQHIPKNKLTEHLLNDGDTVKVIHMESGG